MPVRSAGGHTYEFSGDEYNSNASCLVCVDRGTGFTVESSSINVPTDGAPGSYAPVYRGNHGYGSRSRPDRGLRSRPRTSRPGMTPST